MPDTDRLFQLPLGEFTSARNALAATLKKAGRKDEAEQVKGLAKPSVSAWAVNQLYWNHRKLFDRLMSSGAALRSAQASQLSGEAAELRGPLQERRETLSELSKLAASALQRAQHAPTPETLRRIVTTLEALAIYGDSPEAPQAGRLVTDVDPPGFEALASLVPRLSAGGRSGGPSAVIPFRQKARPARGRSARGAGAEEAREEERRAARDAVQQAERTLRDARSAEARSEAALKTAARKVKAAEAAKAEADERVTRAEAELTAARQEARKVAAAAEEATQAVADAERALERAKQRTAALAE